MSPLRITGLIIGLSILFILLKRLRSHSSRRTDIWLLFLIGGGLFAISLFPDLLNVPADVLSLNNIPGGRIIVLLILSVTFLALLVLSLKINFYDLKGQFDRYIRYHIATQSLTSAIRSRLNGKLVVLMPAYNEETNLGILIPKIPRRISDMDVEVLVVDDGSQDDTRKVAENCNAIVISHPYNRGGGAALRTGYEAAQICNVAILVTMDADCQHDPGEIAGLVRPILNDHADFIIGSRILGTHDNYSRVRIWGVHAFNTLINILMGTNITDCASGFRAIKLSALGKIQLSQDQYHTSELIIDAAKKGLRITEYPIHISARFSGESKKGRHFTYACGFLRTILSTWWR